jgi:hypothetical protein
MIKKTILAVQLLLLTLLSACTNNDPGPLAGTWKMREMPITVQFRSGETESLGMIDKVSYEIKGSDVLVTFKEGMAKGTTLRYTITGNGTARTELGTLQRVK